jgi:hypothetical protein
MATDDNTTNGLATTQKVPACSEAIDNHGFYPPAGRLRVCRRGHQITQAISRHSGVPNSGSPTNASRPRKVRSGGTPDQQLGLLIQRMALVVLADTPVKWLAWATRWRQIHAERDEVFDAARRLRRLHIRCPVIGAEIARLSAELAAMRLDIWSQLAAAVAEPAATTTALFERLRRTYLEPEIAMILDRAIGPELDSPLNRLVPAAHRVRVRPRSQPWAGPWNMTPWRPERRALARALAGVDRIAPLPSGVRLADVIAREP